METIALHSAFSNFLRGNGMTRFSGSQPIIWLFQPRPSAKSDKLGRNTRRPQQAEEASRLEPPGVSLRALQGSSSETSRCTPSALSGHRLGLRPQLLLPGEAPPVVSVRTASRGPHIGWAGDAPLKRPSGAGLPSGQSPSDPRQSLC